MTVQDSVELTTAPSTVAMSALWAAWGDALGFPSELVDETGLQRRLDSSQVTNTVAWSRRVGGRMGPTVALPAGAYSDDTQLRLAVGRCLRANGRFDVEALSKIELPVFAAYELGAGRGTKAAIGGLTRRSVRWYSNFFDGRASRYVDGGGNGAAMRVQPHVWAARDHKPDAYLPGVIRDTLTTHGHPRALAGAVLHALSVGTTLRDGAPPEPGRWQGMVDYLSRLRELVAADADLGQRWLTRWEQTAGRPWPNALEETIDELQAQVTQAAAAVQAAEGGDPEGVYLTLASRLGGLNPKTRGAGTTTAVLALWLAWTHRRQPADGLRLAANTLSSDTDTVATMSGAILGALTDAEPPGPVMDHDLLVAEAHRLDRVRAGEPTESFPHPDPLRWQPPTALADTLGELDDRPAVAGLGHATPLDEPMHGNGRDDALWQWMRLDFGQSVLIKRRQHLKPLPDSARPRVRPVLTAPARRSDPDGDANVQPLRLPDDPDAAVKLLAEHQFDPELTGRLLHHLATTRGGRGQAVEFAFLVAQAIRSQRGGERSP